MGFRRARNEPETNEPARESKTHRRVPVAVPPRRVCCQLLRSPRLRKDIAMMLISHVPIRRSYSRLLHAVFVGLFSVPVWSQATSDSSALGIQATVVNPVAEPAYAGNSHSSFAEFTADRPAEEEASKPRQIEYEPADTLGSGSSDHSFLGSRLESAVEVEGQVSSLSSEAIRSRPGRTVVLKNVTGSTRGASGAAAFIRTTLTSQPPRCMQVLSRTVKLPTCESCSWVPVMPSMPRRTTA